MRQSVLQSLPFGLSAIGQTNDIRHKKSIPTHEQWPRNRREEIYVCGGIEVTCKVGSDYLEICSCRLDEIYDRYIWNLMSHGVYLEMYGDSPASKVVYPQNAGDDIPSHIIEHQNFPYWLAVLVEDG